MPEGFLNGRLAVCHAWRGVTLTAGLIFLGAMLMTACSETVDSQASGGSPRAPRTGSPRQQAVIDYTSCDHAGELGLSTRRTSLRLGEVNEESTDDDDLCEDLTETPEPGTGTGTGTSTNTKVAEVPRPGGMPSPKVTPSPAQTQAPTPPPTSPVMATCTTNGEQCYNLECRGCHGPGPRYAINKSQAGIQAAINRVPAMSAQRRLTPAQVAAISTYLMQQ